MTPQKKRDWGLAVLITAALTLALALLVQTYGFGGKINSLASEADVVGNSARIGILENDSEYNKVMHDRIYLWQQGLDLKIDTLLVRSARNH